MRIVELRKLFEDVMADGSNRFNVKQPTNQIVVCHSVRCIQILIILCPMLGEWPISIICRILLLLYLKMTLFYFLLTGAKKQSAVEIR